MCDKLNWWPPRAMVLTVAFSGTTGWSRRGLIALRRRIRASGNQEKAAAERQKLKSRRELRERAGKIGQLPALDVGAPEFHRATGAPDSLPRRGIDRRARVDGNESDAEGGI